MSADTPKADRVARFASDETPKANKYISRPINQNPNIPGSSSVNDSASLASLESYAPSWSPSTGPESPSNWKASIELSLPTRRRLIRKPLPQLPSEDLVSAPSPDPTVRQAQEKAQLEADLKRADSWWPSILPEPVNPDKRSAFLRENDKQQGPGLDDQSSELFLTILHYAALAPVQSTGNEAAQSSKGVDTQAQYVADVDTLNCLSEALQEALRHLSTKEILGSLQRTASIRWRAEAQLRNAASANTANGPGQSSTSRWARFAWPAAVLGRAYREAQRSTLPPLPPEAGLSSEGMDDNYPLFDEHRIRKRDVAIKILSNAVWFVRNYGPAAGIATLSDKPTTLNEEPGKSDASLRERGAQNKPPSLAATRRTSENFLKIHGGAPNFLPKSSPTTALSGTATPEASTSGSQASAPASSRNSIVIKDDGLPMEKGSKILVEDSAAVPKPEPAVAQPSKAMEHLASLNAAAGAALKAQAMQESASSDTLSSRLANQSSRPSLRSFVSQTEAEAAETAALEKAEREYLAMIGKGCDEWAKMVLCRICASFEIDDGQANGTITARDAEKALLSSQHPGSNLSTRSDMTIRAVQNRLSDDEPVVWVPDVFEGDDLFNTNSTSRPTTKWSKHDDRQQDHEDRVRTVGGTFFFRARDEDEKRALLEVLEVMVYVGCSMLLEASFLRDSDAGRPKIVRVPTRTTSVPEPEQPSDRRRSISTSGVPRPSASPEEEKTTAPPKSPPRGNRRWTKSLWGMLQTKPSIPARTHSRRPSQEGGDSSFDDSDAGTGSLNLTRTRTFDNDSQGTAASKRASVGMPRSKTIAREDHRSSLSSIKASLGAALSPSHSRESSDQNSLHSRANAHIGRLINALGRYSGDIHGDHSGDSGPSRSRSSTADEDPRRYSSKGLIVTRKRAAVFPLAQPGPSPLTTSPELAMLDFYQLPKCFDARAYIDAFVRFQSIRFLTNERADIVAFATPSNGILPSGELYPSAGVNGTSFNGSIASSRYLSALSGSAKGNATQLLGYEIRSRTGPSSLGLRREEVSFYKRLSNSRDVPLGQLIEELCVRASALEADSHHTGGVIDSKPAAGAGKKKDASRSVAETKTTATPEQKLVFLHGGYRINVTATVAPASLVEGDTVSSEADSSTPSDFRSEKKAANNDVSSPNVVSHQSVHGERESMETDISAVAAALHTDKESARTAVAVAETAVRAAEKGTQVLVDGKANSTGGSIWMWNANPRSGWQGRARSMSESTYLMSFARYVEAIIYHPALQRVAGMEPFGKTRAVAGAEVQKQLAEGRSEDSRSVGEGVNLVRLFRSGGALVKIHAAPITTYDLVIDGPVMHGRPLIGESRENAAARRKVRKEKHAAEAAESLRDVAEKLRLEVQSFFASIKQQTTLLESIFVARELDETGKTIRRPPPEADTADDELMGDMSMDEISLSTSVDSRRTISGSAVEPLTLLTKLRSAFRSDEFELYDAIQSLVAPDAVNDIRKVFTDRAKSAARRLGAWMRKHLSKAELAQVGKTAYSEPEYFASGLHAIPGSQFLIRESEPLSIVAFSLSSRDFRVEMGTWKAQGRQAGPEFLEKVQENVINWRKNVLDGSGSQISSASSLTSTSPLREKGMRNVPVSQLDPDHDEVFYEPEPIQMALKRKKRGRESSILSLTLRRVGSTVSSAASESVGSRTPLNETLSSADSDRSSTAGEDDVGSALELESTLDIDDSISGRGTAPRSMSMSSMPRQQPQTQAQVPQRGPSSGTISSAATDSTFRGHVTQASGRPVSLAGIFQKDLRDMAELGSSSRDESATSGADTEAGSSSVPGGGAAPNGYWTLGRGRLASKGSVQEHTDRPSVLTMRSVSESVASSTGQSSATQDGMSLAPSTAHAAVESPHIKQTLIHNHVKISCVSWFAEEFAALRDKWGVEHDFATSLSRCQPWQTTGGKSKSAFFKTLDERFIAKQLLTVWSVDEKEAFLEFAPAYIRYMMNAVVNDCPTLLVKIAGVYSIKIKDVKSGETRLKMNVMVLENLWAGDGGRSVRFDLKGIKDRKLKLTPQQVQQQQAAAAAAAAAAVAVASEAPGDRIKKSATEATALGVSSAATAWAATGAASAASISVPEAATSAAPSPTVWWDSDWIEQYRWRAFVPESQKDLFYQALRNDTQFLTASNVMDYSLLLGVMEGSGEEERGSDSVDAVKTGPILRCRIVDFLGAFTLAKQLESSSKKALKAGLEAKGNVTILPPAEYASRFLTAMDSYFVGVPEHAAAVAASETAAARAVSEAVRREGKERLQLSPVL